jgi:hypothetical protein
MSPVHPDQASDQFRNEFGIPLARPGTAMESAQSVISVMVVSPQSECGGVLRADILVGY